MSKFTRKPPYGSQIDPQHPLSQGLVGCWLMNEAGGDIAYNIARQVPCSLISGPQWFVAGGGALNFTGANYVTTDVTHGTGGSIICKVMLSTLANAVIIAGSQTTTVNKRCYISYTTASGGKFSGALGTVAGEILSTTTPSANVWYHLALTWQGTSASYYLNGKREYSGSPSISVSTWPLYIGALNKEGGITSFLAGLVTDVIMYKRGLNVVEVMKLYEDSYAFIWKPQKYWFMPKKIPWQLFFNQQHGDF